MLRCIGVSTLSSIWRKRAEFFEMTLDEKSVLNRFRRFDTFSRHQVHAVNP